MDLSLRWAEAADLPLLLSGLALVLVDGTDFLARSGAGAVDATCAAYFSDWGRPDDRAVVAERRADGHPLGIAWIRRPLGGGVPFIGLAVRPEARGQGVGAALLRACQRDAMDHGHDLSLTVHCRNPALKLYRRCGFREIGLLDEPSTGPMVRMGWSLPRSGARASRRAPIY